MCYPELGMTFMDDFDYTPAPRKAHSEESIVRVIVVRKTMHGACKTSSHCCILLMVLWTCMTCICFVADLENVKNFLLKQQHLKSFRLTIAGIMVSCKEV